MFGAGTGRSIVVGALASTLAAMPLAAHAQHVVTEQEAAKLTLEALTAPPPRPVYRPVYRAYYRSAMAVRYRSALATRYERTHGWQHAVSRVSYRVETAHHRTVRHRRR